MKIRLITALLIATLATSGFAQQDTAIDDYNFAAWLYNSGKYGLAIDAYRQFLENYAQHDKVAEARFGLAQALFHEGAFEEAASQYEHLLENKPDFAQRPEVLFQLGQAYVAREALDQAIKTFEQLREQYPDHYLADWALARAGAGKLGIGAFESAADDLKTFTSIYVAKASRGKPSSALATMLSRLKEAEVDAGGAFTALVERSLFNLGLAHFNLDRYDQARTAFERFLSLYPDSPTAVETHFRVAQCLYQEAQYVKAAKRYAEVVTADNPFSASAAFERGLALYKTGRFNEASAAFTRMADAYPENEQAPKARLYAGTFLYEAQDYKSAIDHLRPLAATEGPEQAEAAYWLGMSLLKDGQAKAATRIFEAALEPHKDSDFAGDMLLGLADAHIAMDAFTAAAQAFDDFSRRFKQHSQAPQALYSSAMALHRAADYEASDSRCTALLKSDPDATLKAQALFLSAENRFMQKRYDAAMQRYEELLEQDGVPAERRTQARFRVAWIHRYAERFEQAIAALRKIDLADADQTVGPESVYLEAACLFDLTRYPDAIKAFDRYLAMPDHARFGDDALLKKAVAQRRSDNRKAAVRDFMLLIDAYPESELIPQARYQLAETYFDMGDFASASKQYQAVLQDTSAADLHSFAQFGVGLSAYSREAWPQAAAAFVQFAADYPDSELLPQARYRLGRSRMESEQWDEARTAFERMLTETPGHELTRAARMSIAACYQEEHKWKEAAETYARVASMDPKAADQPRVLYELAWSYQEANDPRALQTWEQLVQDYPKDGLASDGWFYLAEEAYRQAMAAHDAGSDGSDAAFALALERYTEVLKHTGDQRLADKALYRVGWCRWMMADYTAASEAFSSLVAEHPKSDLLPDALFQAAQAEVRLNHQAIAANRYRQLVEDPRFDDFEFLPQARLGLAEIDILQGNHAAARTQLKSVLENTKDTAVMSQATFLEAKSYYDEQDLTQARDRFKAVTTQTRSALAAEAQFYIGQIHHAREDYKKALIAYLRVQALYGSYREWVAASLFECAKCHDQLGNTEEAHKARQSLLDDFSDTRWAELAREQLEKE